MEKIVTVHTFACRRINSNKRLSLFAIGFFVELTWFRHSFIIEWYCIDTYREVKDMKKKKIWRLCGSILMIVFLIIQCMPMGEIFAATSLKLVYGGKTVNYTKTQAAFTIDGKNINMHGTPGIIIKNTAVAYYKDVFKTGLQATCKYSSASKQLTITKFDKSIVMTLNSKYAYVNGKKVKMDVPMQKIKYVKAKVTRIAVPVRFVAENLGYQYTWSSSKKSGLIERKWLELQIDGTWQAYTGSKVKASFDGTNISYGKMPGIILDGIAYVNAKPVFDEAIGGSCTYDSTGNTITVLDEDKSIVYKLGTNSATINGVETEVEAQALRIKNRATGKYYLMVPARTTANALGYEYKWNSSTKTSQITSPKLSTGGENGNELELVSGASITFALPVGVAANDVKDTDCYYNNQFYVTLPGDYVSFYQQGGVLIDSSTVSDKYDVELTSDGLTKLTFTTTKLQGYKVNVGKGTVSIEVDDPKNIYKNIVVLDCGHGGSDPGAQGGGYNEKDVTYAILYKYAKNYFDSDTSNIKAYWTRYDDTKISLGDRAAFASKVGADLFISLHMNSSANTSATGTEVFYSTGNNATQSNGLNSKKLADAFLPGMLEVMNLTNRGVKTAQYTVIHKNTVPAILIELGFISNAKDREKIVDEDYQDRVAKKIYETTESIFETYPTGR